jgi:hypothetical protein
MTAQRVAGSRSREVKTRLQQAAHLSPRPRPRGRGDRIQVKPLARIPYAPRRPPLSRNLSENLALAVRIHGAQIRKIRGFLRTADGRPVDEVRFNA